MNSILVILDVILSTRDIHIASGIFRDVYAAEGLMHIYHDVLRNGCEGFDFSEVRFIEPYGMLQLLLVGRQYTRMTGNSLALTGLQPEVAAYLERMDFIKTGIFRVSERDLLRGDKLKRNSGSRRLLEITEIPARERDGVKVLVDVVSRFRKRGSGILQYWHQAEIITDFVTVISEICQNVFEHSMDSGFIAMQTYTQEKAYVTQLVIADGGIGIEKSFEESEKMPDSRGSKLLYDVVTTTISSKRPNGYGLCRVHDIVKTLKGSMYLRSDTSLLGFIFGRSEEGFVAIRENLPAFPGTQLCISLRTEK